MNSPSIIRRRAHSSDNASVKAGSAFYAFIILLDNEEESARLARLLNDLRDPQAEAGCRFVVPHVRGLTFVRQRRSPTVKAWWESNIPEATQCVYLIDESPGLDEALSEFTGIVYVRVRSKADLGRYRKKIDTHIVVAHDPLKFAEVIVRNFSGQIRRLPALFAPEDAKRFGALLEDVPLPTPAPAGAGSRTRIKRLVFERVHSSLRRSTALSLAADELAAGRWWSPSVWSLCLRAWFGWHQGAWLRIALFFAAPLILELTLARWPLVSARGGTLFDFPFLRLGPIATENAIPVLTALWGVEATIFALVIGITSLVMAVSPSAIDAGHLMMSRYRRNAFDPVGALGLAVLVLMAWEMLHLGQNDKAAPITDVMVRLTLLFLVFVAAVGYLVVYSNRLLSKTPREKIAWLEADVDRALHSEIVAHRSFQRLRELLQGEPLHVGGLPRTADTTVQIDQPLDADLCWRRAWSQGQLHDVRIRPLLRWARAVAARWPKEITSSPPLLGVRLDDIKSAHEAVAWLPRNTPNGVSVESLGLRSSLRWRRAVNHRSLNESLGEIVDRAVTAVRESKHEEFTLALDGLRSVYRRIQEKRHRWHLSEVRLGGALQRCIRRLGEEVLNGDSKAIVDAWTKFAQNLLDRKDDSTEQSWEIMNIWLTLAEGVKQGRARSPALVLQCLRERLDTYSQGLSRRLTLSPDSASLRVQAAALIRLCGSLIPIVQPVNPNVLRDIVNSLPGSTDAIRVEMATFWLRYADWCVREYAHQESPTPVAGHGEIVRSKLPIAGQVSPLELVRAFNSFHKRMAEEMSSANRSSTDEETDVDTFNLRYELIPTIASAALPWVVQSWPPDQWTATDPYDRELIKNFLTQLQLVLEQDGAMSDQFKQTLVTLTGLSYEDIVKQVQALVSGVGPTRTEEFRSIEQAMRPLDDLVTSTVDESEKAEQISSILRTSFVLALGMVPKGGPSRVKPNRVNEALLRFAAKEALPATADERVEFQLLHFSARGMEWLPVFTRWQALVSALNVRTEWQSVPLLRIAGSAALGSYRAIDVIVFNPWSPWEYQLYLRTPGPVP